MKQFLLIFLFLWSIFAQAEIRMAVWNPPGFKYAYLVPVREGESLKKAVARYQAAVNMSPDLRASIFKKGLKLKLGKVTPFQENAHETRALVTSNKASDFLPAQFYVDGPGKPLRARGIKSYVLPVAADLGLANEEADEFRAIVARQFDLMVSIGGDDVHPSLYRRPITYAKEPLSITRDLSELKMMQTFIEAKRGFFLGICRGSQLLGIAMGCPLVQDIEIELGVTGHGEGFHPTFIDQKNSRHLARAYPGMNEMEFNTLHHEAVEKGNEKLRVVAWDPLGVVEATELVEGNGMGTQFHTEIMNDEIKNPFFDHIAAEAKKSNRERVRSGCNFRFADLQLPH
ncbi:MAG: gamma-glutamyl-gamma-aminobutyrate hydrolase family protein [Bdellovibrionota bacterium]